MHAPDWCRSLRFNLSHTDGTVACVVTRDVRCGVDVERPRRVLPLHRLTRSVLPPREQREFDAAPAGQRHELFFRYWTVKEAYLKAIGSGMRFPMTACEFDVGTGRPRLRSLGAGPEHAWYTFRQWAVRDGGFLAVAVQGGAGHAREQDVLVRVRTPRPCEENPHPTSF
ncbi:4'-phosphopantetheinyl transferase superfamily protein [Streptomyces hirsutus]